MKKIIKYAGLVLISLVFAACATTQFNVAEKYNLDNELKEATEVTSFRINSWESIDSQSLILNTDINNYYLVILNRPAIALSSSESIGVTVSVDRVRKGFDNIVVTDSSGAQSYIIHKIYKLESREQATEIKKRLKKS
ncbi:MAG: hypothetical protein GX654_12165 [Desulfatiglans sp.]|jgi:hypothetical protein|nr:hypothetical protein [Desulfatiglans sp.]